MGRVSLLVKGRTSSHAAHGLSSRVRAAENYMCTHEAHSVVPRPPLPCARGGMVGVKLSVYAAIARNQRYERQDNGSHDCPGRREARGWATLS